MPAANSLLVVEGPHDLEVVARLLKRVGFGRVKAESKLPEAWKALIPRSFPVNGDLLARHPVPVFLSEASGRIVAIRVAGSDSKIAGTLHRSVSQIASSGVVADSIGVVMDADDKRPEDQQSKFLQDLGNLGLQGRPIVRFPTLPGSVDNMSTPRTGVFIAPDNRSAGTIESLLLEGAGISYADQLSHAQGYVDRFPTDGLTPEDLDEFQRPAGPKKAVVHALASYLRPGKAIQVSIQDNRWLEGAALQQPLIQGLARFLDELIG